MAKVKEIKEPERDFPDIAGRIWHEIRMRHSAA
jgi:hypothetical protein